MHNNIRGLCSIMRRRTDEPMTSFMQSSSGMASLWLHLLRSKVFARSTTGWRSLPARYSVCMLHWVITNYSERVVISQDMNEYKTKQQSKLGQMRTRFYSSLQNGSQLFWEVQLGGNCFITYFRVNYQSPNFQSKTSARTQVISY